MQRVKGEPHLVRTEANVIENIDQDAYQAYMTRKRAANDTKQRLDNLEASVKGIEDKLGVLLNYLTNQKDDGK